MYRNATNIFFLILVFLLCSKNLLMGQNVDNENNLTTSKNKFSIGVSAGIGRNFVNDRIGFYFLPSIIVEYNFSNKWMVLGSLDYFETKYELVKATFQYKNVEYEGMFGQSWINYSFDLGIAYNFSKPLRIGITAGLEKVNIKEVQPDWEKYDGIIFWVDLLTDQVEYYSTISYDKLITPSLTLFAEFDILNISDFTLSLNTHYKLEFVGKKYGKTSLNTVDIFSIGTQIKYSF